MPTDTSTLPAPPLEPALRAPSSSSTATEEFHRHLLTLADAVRELSRSQQTLIDAMTRKTSSAPPTPQPAPPPSPTITGDPGDGLRPSAVVDYTRLSPVQQIALGLRTATAQGPRLLPVRDRPLQPQGAEDAELAPASAD
jgi:hypothetical protein